MILILIAIILLIFIVFQFIIKNKQKGGAIFIGPSTVDNVLSSCSSVAFFPMFGDSGLRFIVSRTLGDMMNTYKITSSNPYDVRLVQNEGPPQPHAVYGLLMYIGWTKEIRFIKKEFIIKFYNENHEMIIKNCEKDEKMIKFFNDSFDLTKTYDFDKYGEYLLDQACFLIIYYFIYMIIEYDKNLTKSAYDVRDMWALRVHYIYVSVIIPNEKFLLYSSKHIMTMLTLLHKIANKYYSNSANVFGYNEIEYKNQINIKPHNTELSIARIEFNFNQFGYHDYTINLPNRPVLMAVGFHTRFNLKYSTIDYRPLSLKQKTEYLTKINQIEKTFGLCYSTHADLHSLDYSRKNNECGFGHTIAFIYNDNGHVIYDNGHLIIYYNGHLINNNTTLIDLANCFHLNGNILTVKPKRTLLFDVTRYHLQFFFSDHHDNSLEYQPSYFYRYREIQNILTPKQLKLIHKIEQQLRNIENGNYDNLSLEQTTLIKMRNSTINLPNNFPPIVSVIDRPKSMSKPIPEAPETIQQIEIKPMTKIKDEDVLKITHPVIDHDTLTILDPNKVNLYKYRDKSPIEIKFNKGTPYLNTPFSTSDSTSDTTSNTTSDDKIPKKTFLQSMLSIFKPTL